jgi:glycerol-3-phosphate acyltransferase PlsY
MLTTILLLVFAYLIGSIATSVWVGKYFYNIDVRQHGSGNAGATNTIRVLGWKAGLRCS